MTTDKSRARDEEGTIVKSQEPDADYMIDPFVYALTSRAVNYDRRWASTVRMGPNTLNALAKVLKLPVEKREEALVGLWVTTPFHRTGHGTPSKNLLKKLREQGVVKWEENCFFFSHDMGRAALQKYLVGCCIGNHKANGKSWKNKYAKMTGVSFEDLETGNMEPIKEFLENQTSEETFKSINWDAIRSKLRTTYKKTATTYINQEEKNKRVNGYFKERNESIVEFFESLEDPDDLNEEMPEIKTIADATNLSAKDVIKTLEKLQPKETIAQQEDIPDAEIDISGFDIDSIAGPTTEMLDEVEEVVHLELTELDGDGDAEQDEPIAVPELGTAVAAAAVTATEVPAASSIKDPDEEDDEDEDDDEERANVKKAGGMMFVQDISRPHEHVSASDKVSEYHQVTPTNLKSKLVSSYQDATLIDLEANDGVTVEIDKDTTEKLYLLEMPAPIGHVMLPEGEFLIGSGEDGRTYRIVHTADR